jgi:hypothetical protein
MPDHELWLAEFRDSEGNPTLSYGVHGMPIKTVGQRWSPATRPSPTTSCLVFSLCWLAALPAQWRTDQGVRGTFIHASRISRDVARSSCLDLGDPTFVPQARRVEPCRPRALRSLARIGGLVWSSGEYNSRWVLAPGDTEEEREIVLYRPEELRSVRLVLKALRPPDANTDALIAVDECVNGTGGCAQTFMSYRDGHGKGVVRQFEDSLRQRFPGAINHGYHVDLASMRFEASVFSPRDANCCPSHVAVGAVTFRGDTLRLASLRLRDAVNK